jgi:arylsulfatase A-like enzyme
MISRMDRDVGRLMDLVTELGLDDNTLFVFTSDNGPSWVGGVDFEYFGSQGGLRGRKAQLWEGGIRVPTMVRWTGQIEAGSLAEIPSAFWDWLPTLTDLTGARTPEGIDGVSLVPTLIGSADQQEAHEYLYWEYVGGQAVRLGDWKGIRFSVDDPIELYDLANDPAETTDVAAAHPDVVSSIREIMTSGRTESDLFPLVRR